MAKPSQPTTDLPIEEQAERVRMCLAEAGYPDPTLVFTGCHPQRGNFSVCVHPSIPDEVAFKAGRVVGIGKRCWPCFSRSRACWPDDHAEGCTGDGWFL